MAALVNMLALPAAPEPMVIIHCRLGDAASSLQGTRAIGSQLRCDTLFGNLAHPNAAYMHVT